MNTCPTYLTVACLFHNTRCNEAPEWEHLPTNCERGGGSSLAHAALPHAAVDCSTYLFQE